MELLRTIHKNTNKPKNAPQANISSLGSKWKQMQASFGFDEPAATSPQKSSADSRSPFTPLSGSECTRVERVVAETNNSLMAKSAAVMKVLKDASLSFQNLSTSPSGRLDALVAGPPSDFQLELTPRLQVNDVTILVRFLATCPIKIRSNSVCFRNPKLSSPIRVRKMMLMFRICRFSILIRMATTTICKISAIASLRTLPCDGK